MKQRLNIKKVKIYQIKIPFSLQVTHNLAKRSESSGFLVEIQDHKGLKGYGEGTPRPYVTGEQTKDTTRALKELSEEISGRDFASEDILFSFLEGLSENGYSGTAPSAVCALELALLDLLSKRLGVPLWKIFRSRPASETITYSSILPLLDEKPRQAILRLTNEYKINQIKTKASDIDSTVEVVDEIIRALGEDTDIRVDANAAFSSKDAVRLVSALKKKGLSISCMEQPVAKDDLEGLKKVEEDSGIPVIADESFCSDEDLERIISNKSCSGINVRLSKCGGMLKSAKIVERAKKAGMFCQLGCHVGETSVLSAAGRHLAALCGPFRFVEGCYSRFLLKDDVAEPPLEFGLFGNTSVPEKPGLGLDVTEEALKRCCIPLFKTEN